MSSLLSLDLSCISIPKKKISLYLPVDGSYDGGAQTHARDKADVEVLLEDERLHTGTYEEQRRVEVAVPVGGAGVVDEADQQPGWDGANRKSMRDMLTLINEITKYGPSDLHNPFRDS